VQEIAKSIIILGVAVVCIGLLLLAAGKLPFIGKLPGDILIQKKDFTFYFPLTTSILASIVLSFIFWLWSRR